MTADQRQAWRTALACRAATRRRNRHRRTAPPIRAGMIRMRAAPPATPTSTVTTGPKA